MVEVVEGLKAKLAEFNAKMEELQREIVVLDDQRVAFETVIKVFEPGFELAASPSKTRRASYAKRQVAALRSFSRAETTR